MGSTTVPSLAWDHQVYDRANHIVEKLDENPEFSKTNAPGLRDLLSDFASPDVKVSDADFHRRLLQVLKDSETDGTYSSMLKMYTPEEQDKIQRFVAGEKVQDLAQDFVPGPSLGCRQGIDREIFLAKSK